MNLADQVADLAMLVRLLLAVSVVQLLLLLAVAVRGESTRRIAKAAHEASPVFLAKAVEALTASVDELTSQVSDLAKSVDAMERRMGNVEGVVDQLDRDLRAVEDEAGDASHDAGRAIEIVKAKASEEDVASERAFLESLAKPARGGGE